MSFEEQRLCGDMPFRRVFPPRRMPPARADRQGISDLAVQTIHVQLMHLILANGKRKALGKCFKCAERRKCNAAGIQH